MLSAPSGGFYYLLFNLLFLQNAHRKEEGKAQGHSGKQGASRQEPAEGKGHLQAPLQQAGGEPCHHHQQQAGDAVEDQHGGAAALKR